ncbi:MAG TPA: cysteine--tRNA ligase [Steroidobacteraceae bacterium]|nr:cysteine--tRNA ligase [Steroidobacteraceae bacterium]
MIEIHNSYTGRKEPLRELEPGHVRMYVCGMTVYDYCHVGHARSLIVFDVVRRYLKYRGYRVTHVRNITDIDDKIIARAAENGETVSALTERFIAALREDCAALGVETPEHEPRATEYVAEIIAMVRTLIDKGYAYVAPDGDVLYSVSGFPAYGRLSGKRLAELRAGARVEVDAGKRDPLDFVLWKMAKPAEPRWDSPWGAGRPGWHIECSAMSVALLGSHFDVHGGGMDLKFPHHENEIAQSCAACGTPFVNVWMHNGFVNVDAEKMSKSLGNFFTVREVLARIRPEVLRAFVLASHYRGPVNYSDENLRHADATLERLYGALRGAPAAGPDAGTMAAEIGAARERFELAMDDDFNTPEALAVLLALARDLNVAKAAGDAPQVAALATGLRRLGGVLGILAQDPETWLQTRPATGLAPERGAVPQPDAAEIDALVAARTAARKARNFAESDRLRDQLVERGVVLEDGPLGTRWRWR